MTLDKVDEEFSGRDRKTEIQTYIQTGRQIGRQIDR
jgi:hypothetical protein